MADAKKAKKILVIQNKIDSVQEFIAQLKADAEEANFEIGSLRGDIEMYAHDTASSIRENDFDCARSLVDDAESASRDIEDHEEDIRIIGGKIVKADSQLRKLKEKLKETKSKK